MLTAFAGAAFAQQPAGEPQSDRLSVGRHSEVVLDADLERVAIGDPKIAGVEVVSTRRLLLLGRAQGATTLTIWFEDGQVAVRSIEVRPDLTLLERALTRIDPEISLEIASDRTAVVLTGTVEDIAARDFAERTVREYLGASLGERSPVMDTTGATQDEPVSGRRDPARIVNLLVVRSLPATLEERIEVAIGEFAGDGVRVRRLVLGALPDDSRDVLVLEGKVPDQVTLTRVLHLVSRLFLGEQVDTRDMRVVADESGALVTQGIGQQQAGQGLGGGGLSRTSSVLGGGGGGQILQALNNRIRTNLGRATVIEVAKGRIVSFLEVQELPQVRVAIRLYEVERSALLSVQSDVGILNGDVNQGSLAPPALGETLRGPGQSVRTGSVTPPDVQNALGFLAGVGLTEQLQIAGSRFAIDAVFRVLETAGVAKELSAPTLTVLSGEAAQFQVGGSLPITQTFSPAFGGGDGQGTFSAVTFEEFGVQLAVRPLVGENDAITMDLSAQIAQPDQDLSTFLREASGAEQLASTAFSSRSLFTSARVDDGQSLLVGGLVGDSSSRSESQVPLLADIPLLGWLFKSRGQDRTESELFIVLSPVIVHDQLPKAGSWSAPTAAELLRLDWPAYGRWQQPRAAELLRSEMPAAADDSSTSAEKSGNP